MGRFKYGRWVDGLVVGSQWVGGRPIVGRWLVAGGRWFCNTPNPYYRQSNLVM